MNILSSWDRDSKFVYCEFNSTSVNVTLPVKTELVLLGMLCTKPAIVKKITEEI